MNSVAAGPLRPPIRHSLRNAQHKVHERRRNSTERNITSNKRPVIPQSEVLAKFVQETGEKCGETSAKTIADFRVSVSRKKARKKFHEKNFDISTVHQIEF